MTSMASDLVAALHERSQPAAEAGGGGSADEELQLPMRDLFDIAKAHRELPLSELEVLLDEPVHQVRLAAVCVLDFKARAVGTREERRPLRELYLRRHDRIDTWDMVDRAAPWVVGGSLDGHDLSALQQLAVSPHPIERRSAITAPLYFVKFGDDDEVDRSFEIASKLAEDPETVVHKAVGIFIKHAGRRLPEQQRTFLERHAATMARPGLRLAIAKLDPSARQRYLDA
jgi:3-methyladenine DNA glycosylase AlkD